MAIRPSTGSIYIGCFYYTQRGIFEMREGAAGAVKVVSGNILGDTRPATLVVEEKYLNFDRGGAYATAFLLALVSVACIVVVTIIRPKEES